MDEKRSYAAPIAAVVLLLLPCLYVGSYYALVERDAPVLWRLERQYPERYRIGGNVPRSLFWPIHNLDRRIRPSYWTLDFERIGVDFGFTIEETEELPASDILIVPPDATTTEP